MRATCVLSSAKRLLGNQGYERLRLGLLALRSPVAQSVYEIVLYLCALAVVYTYAGYPALIGLWSKLVPRPVKLAGIQPPVAIVVIAHNEEARIAAKLRSCLGQDYPEDRFRVLVALDGSTDGTRAIVESFCDRRVDVLAFPVRRGKAACLKRCRGGLQ